MKKSDKHKDHAEEKEHKDKGNVDIKNNSAEEQPNEIEILKNEVNFYKDALMRKAAEFENYKKRSDVEISNYLKYASESLIKSLLPVYDDLTRSIESVEKGETKDFETLKQGVQLVTDKFKSTLANEGLTEIDILGKEFDVNTCDALLQVPRDDVPPHTVVEVIEKGYKLKDKVIKFAKVIVSTEKRIENDKKRDYYEILGVNKSSSNDEIKSAYRKLAMKYHPDKNPGDKESEEMFKECAEAYEVLSDPQKKQRYDQFGHQGVNSTGFSGFDNVNDIFSHFGDIFGGFGGGSIFDEFFGGGSSRGRRHSQGIPGTDMKITLRLSYEEIADGTEKIIKIKKLKTCKTCHGTGAKSSAGYVTCSVCKGAGEIKQVSRSIFGQFVNVAECNNCNGEGKIVKDKCTECHGDGRTKEEETETIKIPAGVSDGQYLSLRGRGNAGARGGHAGDLMIFIEEEKHEYFIRDNDDIIYNLKISLSDAILGVDAVVPTLNGKAKLKVEPGTQSGSVLRMRDKGIRHLNSGGRGDQLVKIHIFIPKKISSKEKTILKELGKSENFVPQSNNDKGFFKSVFN